MNTIDRQNSPIARAAITGWFGVAGVLVMLTALYFDGIQELLRIWGRREEYSHGYFIPMISLFVVWTRWRELVAVKPSPTWYGLVVCMVGALVLLAGELSTLYVLVQYSLVPVLAGLVLACVGWKGLKLLWMPLVFLLFMIPLPPFLYFKLSAALQLISSQLGVDIVRWFGISVYLEGNVIDLGSYKLQVVEACSGLRYLFPLASFGFICAYIFQAPLWQRALVFLSTVPITVLTNSFRIGVTGVLVEHHGITAAEGFLHYFEGWVIFMACVASLLAVIWLLTRLRRDGKGMHDVFGFEVPERPVAPWGSPTAWPRPFVHSCILLTLTALGASALAWRPELIPKRAEFVDFPLNVGRWTGRRDSIEPRLVDVLKVTDYIMADYADDVGDRVNLYVAYYESQRKGRTAHSPRACIPGGGWEIVDLSTRIIDTQQSPTGVIRINRVEIRRGNRRQLVYYWFQQRGRVITSEYAVKAHLLWDALWKQRTDGALVRLTAAPREGEPTAVADKRLVEFTKALNGVLSDYVPR